MVRRIAMVFLKRKRPGMWVRGEAEGALRYECHGRDVIWDLNGPADRDARMEDSWRDGRVDSGIDLRSHDTGPEDLSSALADLRLRFREKKA